HRCSKRRRRRLRSPPRPWRTGLRTSAPGKGRSTSSTSRRCVSTTEPQLSTAADLAAIRELKPLVHQITNYVVMNETANATLELAVVRGNAAEIATLSGRSAEIRGVESIGSSDHPAELARTAARELGVTAAVTGAVDHVSDGERVLAIGNGHPLLGSITGSGC